MVILAQRPDNPSEASLRLELAVESLQEDVEELTLKLESHMRQEFLDRRDTIERITTLKLYLAVVIALTGADLLPVLWGLL